MSNETLVYVCGIILALSAVGVSFIGLKVKSFPGKAMPIVVLWFALFVGATTTFAVLHAKDEDASKAKEARFEEANEKAEKEAGDVAPEGTEEGAQGGTEEEAEEGAEGFEEAEGEAGVEEGEPGGEEGEAGGEEGEAAGGEEAEAGQEGGGDPEAGKAVFAENCSICHGSDGHGGNGGPDLRTMPKAKTEAGSIEQVTDGGGGMPPFGSTLSEEEIENVAAYVVQDIVGAG